MAGFSFKSLRFPENLGTTDVPNYIRFIPKVVQYGGTESLKTGTNGISPPTNNPIYSRGNSIGGIVGNIAAGVGGLAQTASGITNAVSGAVSTLSSSPLSIKNVVGAGGQLLGRVADITGTTLGFGIKTTPDQLKSAGTINLYLPQNLETNSSVDYETAALGGMGTSAVEATQSLLDKSSTRDIVGSMIGALAQDAIASGNRRAIVGIAQNRVTNNFSFQVFNSVLHRQFSYEFRMMAKNGNESNVIKQICDTFLFYMLPARTDIGGIGFYEVPCQWEIKYMRQGGPLKYHMQPRNCFLQSVDVGYGGDAQNSTYNDGAPMEVTIRLQFIEVEPLYRIGQFTSQDSTSSNNVAKETGGYDEIGTGSSQSIQEAAFAKSLDGTT